MYFFQAFESIEAYVKGHTILPDCEMSEPIIKEHKEHAHECLKNMMAAQRFHLGDFRPLLEIGMAPSTDPNGSPAFFKGQWGESINLPFENIWLDFQYNDCPKGRASKGGALIVGDTNGGTFTIYHMVYSHLGWGIPLTLKSIEVENGEMIPNAYENFSHAKSLLLPNVYREIAAVNCFLKLINCKNIEADTIEPAPKLNKKRLKKGKKPFLSYKVLTLKLPSKGNMGTSIACTGVKQRMHVCRGHYKTYTESKPLMGKITGTFWWQPSIRGSKKSGAITKDYKIKTD